MNKLLIIDLFGNPIERCKKEPCPYCGKLLKRINNIHLAFCSKNPKNNHPLLGSIEEIPSQTNIHNNEILHIPFLGLKELELIPIKGRYWAKRQDVNNLNPEYKISRRQFINLTKEWVPDFNCYWLEEGIEKDFIRMDRNEFRERFSTVKSFHGTDTGSPYVLLSVSGILKMVSRSSKMKTILYWLIMKFTQYSLLKYEIERFWKMLQKTESPAELYYLCAGARILNINRLETQKIIGNFRGDLVIGDKFLIMIKGREYHIDSGVKKIYDDTIRERCIQKEGYFCITFWGYEIFQNVEKCVQETIEIIYSNRNRLKSIK